MIKKTKFCDILNLFRSCLSAPSLQLFQKGAFSMSVNYHAFQSRNVLFPEAGAVCEQWRAAFSGYDPSRIAAILRLTYDASFLYLSYFGADYRLRLDTGVLEKRTEETPSEKEKSAAGHAAVGTLFPKSGRQEGPEAPSWTENLYFNETMAIYHLLKYTKDQPRTSGIWVPNTELDGASIRSRQSDPLLTPFSLRFTGKTPLLRRQCEALGGHALPVKGDAAYLFYAFPQIPLRLIFWDADEDFPAQTQVLVDSRITDYLHYESVGCVISDLLEKLEAGTSD